MHLFPVLRGIVPLSFAVIALLLFQPHVTGQEPPGSHEDAVVHLTVFTTSECSQCAFVKDVLLPQLKEVYGKSLMVEFLDADGEDSYQKLVALEEQYGDSDNQFPVIFCGRRILGGQEEAESGLRGAIQECLEGGGCPPPQLQAEPERAQEALENAVYIAYFHTTGCQKCGRVEHMLTVLQRQYADLIVKSFDLSQSHHKELAEAMGRRCGLSEGRRLIAPSLFIGQDALVGDEIRETLVRDLIEKYQAQAGGPIWELVAEDTSQGAQGIIQRFQSLGVLTVMAAGLIDGVNPCAFATIVFFVSYLAFLGRQKRDVLLAGVAFTTAVFLTYLTMGLGLFQFLQRIAFVNLLSQIIYGLIALLALVLGVISLYDYGLIRRGHKSSEMKLQLPLYLKRRIHATIREQSRSGRLAVAALICGAVISVMELACTGQVYLPTIVFVMGVSSLRAHAFLFLLLYNLCFVLPLAVVFLLSYAGVTSQQMGAAVEAHLGRVKLILGLFFLFLCGLLTYILLT